MMQDSFWKKMDAFVPVLANYLMETRARRHDQQAQYYADISAIAVSLKRIAESIDCVANPELISDELISKKKSDLGNLLGKP